VRPCRPYAVVTLDHSICEGGHIYTWSTIQDTVYGIFHTFVESQFVTNTEHTWESKELLRRIVTYYHLHFVEEKKSQRGESAHLAEFKRVNRSFIAPSHHIPDLTDFADVVRLLSLLNVVILGEIIYPPFYEDVMEQSDPPKEFLFAIARRKAAGLLTHFSMTLNLLKCGRRVGFKPLFVTFFVQQVRSLIRQHSQSSTYHRKRAGNSEQCTTEKLCQMIAASFSEKDWFFKELLRQKKIGYCNTTYGWLSQEKYSMGIEKNGLGASAYPSSHFLKLHSSNCHGKARISMSNSLKTSFTTIRM